MLPSPGIGNTTLEALKRSTTLQEQTLADLRTAVSTLLRCAIQENDASLLMLATAGFAFVLSEGIEAETMRTMLRNAGMPDALAKIIQAARRFVRPRRKPATKEQRQEAEALAQKCIDVEFSEFDLNVIIEKAGAEYQAWLVEDLSQVGRGRTFSQAREDLLTGLQRRFREHQRQTPRLPARVPMRCAFTPLGDQRLDCPSLLRRAVMQA